MDKGLIFVRVSKKEQDYQRQLEDLRALAKTQNLEIVAEIAEKISGAKDNQERDGVQIGSKGYYSESSRARSFMLGAFNGRSFKSLGRINELSSQRLCSEFWF